MWQFKVSFTNITGLGEFCFQLEFSESKGCVSFSFSSTHFLVLHSIKNWIGPYQRTPKEVAIEPLDTQVFSGSVQERSCWRFLGYITTTPFFLKNDKDIPPSSLLSCWHLRPPGRPQSRGSPSISAPKSYDGGLGAPNDGGVVVDVEFRCLCDVIKVREVRWWFFRPFFKRVMIHHHFLCGLC